MFDAKFKLQFFDRQSITDPAEKAAARNLSKMGAYVMRSARKSIKSKDGPSRPGTPPHAHSKYEVEGKGGKTKTRYRFRDSILFGRAPGGGLVVGPVFKQGSRGNPTVPESLEFGGMTTIGGKTRPTRNLKIRRRPFMRPALDANVNKFADLFRNAITR